jgi:hypothetical protein
MMKDGRAGHSGLAERPILNELKVIVAEVAEKGSNTASRTKTLLALGLCVIRDVSNSQGGPAPGDLVRCRLRASGGLFDKLCDSPRLRYIDGVAALDLNDRGTRPLGHGTLGVRWDHLVLGGYQVPARLGPPRGFADRAANGPHAPRNLGISHKPSFFWVHVGGERGWELRLVEKQKAVLRGQYRRYRRAGRRVFCCTMLPNRGSLHKNGHRIRIVTVWDGW